MAHPAGLSAVAELRTNGIDAHGAGGRLRPLAAAPDRPTFVIEVGRIPPVVGAFPRRAYGRDNLVLGLPLAYQYVTSLRPDALPATVDDLLRMRGRGWQPCYPSGRKHVEPGVPLVSGSTWDTGVEARGACAVSSSRRRDAGSARRAGRARDQRGVMVSARASVQLPLGILVGVSGARGEWIDDDVLSALPAVPRDTAQSALVLDAEAGDGPWLVRAELAAFDVRPAARRRARGALSLVGLSGFVEARYRVRPRWQVAARLDRLSFSRVAAPGRWVTACRGTRQSHASKRVVAFRVTRAARDPRGLAAQLAHGGRVRGRGYPALGATFWF